MQTTPLPANELRIAVGGLLYETNSFAPGEATLDTLRHAAWADGDDVLRYGHGIDSIAGAVAVARSAGVEIVPTTAAGPVSGPAFRAGEYATLRSRLLDGLRPLAGRVDGVYLSLHGAMVCADQDDVEGDLLESVAELMGVPVAASLDLHAHFTDAMGNSTPLLAGFRTLPHVDMVETGARAMTLLLRRLSGGRPTLAWVQIPMLTSAEGQDTNIEPVRGIMARLEEMLEDPRVLDGSLFMTQPWLDVPELGWTALVITDDAPDLAADLARELAERAWSARDAILAPKTDLTDAITRVSATPYDPALGPLVLSDGADSVSAGAAGDGVELAAALSQADLPGPAYVIVTDAAAARRCHAAGVGARISTALGGTISTAFFTPRTFEGRVISLHDGTYTSLYPPRTVEPGLSAVLRTANGLHLLITERPVPQLDLEPYRRVGVEPERAHVLVAKSAGGYRAAYEPIARECIDVGTSGPADARLTHMPFRRITRPLYPFDQHLSWRPIVRFTEGDRADG